MNVLIGITSIYLNLFLEMLCLKLKENQKKRKEKTKIVMNKETKINLFISDRDDQSRTQIETRNKKFYQNKGSL